MAKGKRRGPPRQAFAFRISPAELRELRQEFRYAKRAPKVEGGGTIEPGKYGFASWVRHVVLTHARKAARRRLARRQVRALSVTPAQGFKEP